MSRGLSGFSTPLAFFVRPTMSKLAFMREVLAVSLPTRLCAELSACRILSPQKYFFVSDSYRYFWVPSPDFPRESGVVST